MNGDLRRGRDTSDGGAAGAHGGDGSGGGAVFELGWAESVRIYNGGKEMYMGDTCDVPRCAVLGIARAAFLEWGGRLLLVLCTVVRGTPGLCRGG